MDKKPPLSSTRDAYGKTLAALGEKDKRLVVLDADLSGSTRTGKFGERFPHRFFNMGVSEADMIGTAAGLALGGMLPFASTFAIFLTGRAWEQIRQAICYPNLNVKLVSTHGGITVGEDGPTHHSIEDLALMRVLPNMTVIVPTDAYETEKVILAAAEQPGPFYIRLSRDKFPVILDRDCSFNIGQARLVREGKDLTIIAVGLMVSVALEAAEFLEGHNCFVRVLAMPTIKPIDKQAIIQAAKETGAILTVEEHSIIGGLGSAVAEVLVEHRPIPMRRVGIGDKYGFSAKPGELLEEFGLTVGHIVAEVQNLLERKNKFIAYQPVKRFTGNNASNVITGKREAEAISDILTS